ncbi:hypothetical protein BKA63DRAFT_166359 [Paraphoma chrysanthemicola]|nr:hypothetical protein BKA63DRAFT_166359 [Paraphoma chrysanthemicola]
MALFTKFKKAKDAAVEHKKTAAAQQAKAPSVPYRHVPTHAAQDALAAQPMTLKPEELQARIAKARKRRASSYQSPVAARHSVYHSCESSRMSSRTSSTAQFASGSKSSSVKGHNSGAGSIDAVMRRSQSFPQPQGMSIGEHPFLSLGGSSAFLSPSTPQPRASNAMSSRSSFAKTKSPLSNISSDEESNDIHTDGSVSSAPSFGSDHAQFGHPTTKASTAHAAATVIPDKHAPKLASPEFATASRRSRWSLLPRKNATIVAH